MSIKQIREFNPEYEFYTTKDPQFEPFGRVLSLDASKWCTQAGALYPLPDAKASYIPNDPKLHEDGVIKTIQEEIFGHLAIQVGIVHGWNTCLTGIEFHQGSEVNIALRDCILLLGRKQDMEGTSYDAAKTMKFYITKGEVIEIYSSTLHYTPIQADAEGFSLGVILLEGTNTDLETAPKQMLTKKNKWYITHPSQTKKIEAGCIAGLQGEMIRIKHSASKSSQY